MKIGEGMVLSMTPGDLRVVGSGRESTKVVRAYVESKDNMEKWNGEKVK